MAGGRIAGGSRREGSGRVNRSRHNIRYRKLPNIASHAPNLKEAELRVLLTLAAMADQTEHQTVRISSRKLAERARVERRNVVRALDALTARGLITTRAGTTKTASAYLVNALETLLMGGVITTPPQAEQRRLYDTTLASEKPHPGVTATPPPIENKGLARMV